MSAREEIVREVARAMCASEDQDSAWHCTDACVREQECARLGKPIKCLYRDLAEAAVSLCFARAAEVLSKCADEVFGGGYAGKEDGYRFAADAMSDFVAHHGATPTATISSATATPTHKPASDAARSEGG